MGNRAERPGPDRRLLTAAALMALTSLAYAAGRMWPGDGTAVLRAVGAGACAWCWLAARALFTPETKPAAWPRVIASAVAASGALSVLVEAGAAGEVFTNLYVLGGSAALVMTFVEPLGGGLRDLTSQERRFRLIFTAGYAVLVMAAVIGPQGGQADPEAIRRMDLLKSACAALGLAGVTAATIYRLGHPLQDKRRTARRAATDQDRELSARILELVRREEVFGDPELRVADVAARLREPEYRVSQCITGVLGFENFNRLINRQRIDRARRLLVEAGPPRPILDVAFDCGFASLGPFNRAFKAETGLTPRAYRLAAAAKE